MEFLRKPFTFFSHGSKKRGISAIVAVVLTILITVSGVVVIWTAIVPIIKEGVEFENYNADLMIDSQGGYTYYDAVKKVSCVQVRRRASEGTLIRIDVVFSFEGTTYVGDFSGEEVPGINEAKMKCFDLGDFDGKPDSVGLAPVFLSGNKESVGEVSSEVVKLKKGSYSGSGDDLGIVGDECDVNEDCEDETELFCSDDTAVKRLTEYSCSAENRCVGEVSSSSTDCSDTLEVCFEGECVECGVNGDCGVSGSVVVCDGDLVVDRTTTYSCDLGACSDDDDDVTLEDCTVGGGICSGGVCSAPVAGPYDIDSCGVTLSESGQTYTLISDISDSSTCITVNVDSVSIDLNGHTISGSGSGSGVYVDGVNYVNVYGGSINGFSEGVYLRNSYYGYVYDNNFDSNSYAVLLYRDSAYDDYSYVYNNYITSSSSAGIQIYYSQSNYIYDNTFGSGNYNGIEVYGFYDGSYYGGGNSITGNTMDGNSGYGIYLSYSDNNYIDNNTVCGSYYGDLYCNGDGYVYSNYGASNSFDSVYDCGNNNYYWPVYYDDYYDCLFA